MLAEALKARTQCLNVSRPFGFETDHIVQVGRHLLQALHNFVENLDE